MSDMNDVQWVPADPGYFLRHGGTEDRIVAFGLTEYRPLMVQTVTGDIWYVQPGGDAEVTYRTTRRPD